MRASPPPPFVHHMQGIKLEVMSLIKPGADKVIEPEAGPAGQRQGIDHKLGNGLVPDRVRFVVEDMDASVADLHEIDVAGQRGLRGEGNGVACQRGEVMRSRDTNGLKKNLGY